MTTGLWEVHTAIHASIKGYMMNGGHEVTPAVVEPILTWNLSGSPAVSVALPKLRPDLTTEEGEIYQLEIWISAVHDRSQVDETDAVRQVVKIAQILAQWYSQHGRFGGDYWQSIKWKKFSEWMRVAREPNRKAMRAVFEIYPR